MRVITAKNLNAPEPSGEWMQKLTTSMAAFAGPSDPIATCLYDKSWGGRQAVHCIYSVGLRTIADPKGLEKYTDKPFCWRFIAGGHKNMTMAAGCLATHALHGPDARVMAAFHGAEMAEVLANTEQLNDLKELTGHPADNYEMRVLRIPALYIEAFWLRCTKKGDLMVPYGLLLDGKGSIKVGAKGRLTKGKAYPVAEFLKIVGKAARQRLKADEKKPPPRN